jgi:hypothetical protein
MRRVSAGWGVLAEAEDQLHRLPGERFEETQRCEFGSEKRPSGASLNPITTGRGAVAAQLLRGGDDAQGDGVVDAHDAGDFGTAGHQPLETLAAALKAEFLDVFDQAVVVRQAGFGQRPAVAGEFSQGGLGPGHRVANHGNMAVTQPIK